MTNVLIVAAEASSSLYAQRILERWKAQNRPIRAFGVGSESMENLGFEIVGRSESMAVVGLVEVLARIGEIWRVFYSLLRLARERKPAFALLIDYPDFNLRLAKRLKKMGVPVIYYVSPQIWAWRQSRVFEIKKNVSRMLVLFPFEVDFYKKFDVPVDFVGHPLLDEMDKRFFDPDYRKIRRGRYGISENDVLLALMPGSRFSELKNHMQVQIEAAARLTAQLPHLKVALLVAPTFSKEEIYKFLPKYDINLMIIKDDPMEMIMLADAVLVASGTATLLVGLLKKPMVVMYRMKAFTAWIAKKFVRSVANFGLINLVIGKRVAPEFFQEEANSLKLSQELIGLLQSPEQRQLMSQNLEQAHHRLGDHGATDRVLKILDGYL